MPNDLSNFIPEVWSTNVIANIDRVNLAMKIMTNTDYEGEIRQQGDTVHVRTFGNVTVRSYTRGATLVREDLVPTKELMYVDQADYFDITVDDLDSAQNDINALAGYTRRAGVAMAEKLDDYIFDFTTSALAANRISNGGSAIDISATATDSTHPYAIIVEAARLLDEQNVDRDGRWFIVSPYFRSLLMRDTVYFNKGSQLADRILTTAMIGGRQMTAGEASSMGYVGMVDGFEVFSSTNLKTTGSSRYCVFGQGRPVSFAAQLQPGSVEAIRRSDTFGTDVRGLMLYGGTVFAEHSKRLGYALVDNS